MRCSPEDSSPACCKESSSMGGGSDPLCPTKSTTKTNGKPISFALQRKWHPGQSWEKREYTARHWRGGHRNLSEELRERRIDLQWYSFQSFNSTSAREENAMQCL